MLTKKEAVAAPFYQRYIDAAKGNDVVKSLRKNRKDFIKLLESIPEKKRDYAYQEDKWTIRELLQHLLDAERVFIYRAIRFARKDETALHSFNENEWAAQARAGKRNWNDLVSEFKALRKSTEFLFKSFDDDQLLSKGTASDNIINVLALGYIVGGHTEHHMRVLEERYLS
jgi:hypothetical protein